MILHADPPEFIAPKFIALSFLEPLDSRTLTRALWEKMPECVVIFPDGVKVAPLLRPGTVENAEASSPALETSRANPRSHPGLFLSKESPNKIFALVETIEKAAAIHRNVRAAGGPKQTISTEILRRLAEKFAPIMVTKPAWLEGER